MSKTQKKRTGGNSIPAQERSAEDRSLLEGIERRARDLEAFQRSALNMQKVVQSAQHTELLRRSVESRALGLDVALRVGTQRLETEAGLYERWTRKEQYQSTEAAQEIVRILSADKVNWHAANAWIAEHGTEIGAGMVAAIIEGAMKQAMVKISERATRARITQAKTRERYAIVLKLWSANPAITKIDLACQVADLCAKFSKQAKTQGDAGWKQWEWSMPNVRRWLQGKTLDDVRLLCATV